MLTDWTFLIETKFAHVPAEVKRTKTTNGTQMTGIKQPHTPQEKTVRQCTSGL
jgi:hypothetical protein